MIIFILFWLGNMMSIVIGHASQAARVNTLEVPAYRVYTLEELQEATNNFGSSNLIKSSPVVKVCRSEVILSFKRKIKAINAHTNDTPLILTI